MTEQPLILRHRPASFDAVRGNPETVASLQRRLADPRRPHAYLFTGPSGVGKTTLARLIGLTLSSDIIEIDAASNNGVDAMRALVDLGHYVPPAAQSRLIVIDECHTLSSAAWQAALKMLEEPPDHLYLALCTTELSKVPETVVTRCNHVKLDRLSDAQVADFLVEVLLAENWADTIQDDVFQMVVAQSLGSPRQALTLLQAVYDAPNLTEAQRIVALQGPTSPLIQLLNLVIRGQGGWATVRPLLAQLSDDDVSEGGLIRAARYVVGALQREENDDRAKRLWEFLACFVYPAHSYDPRSIFYAAVGRYLWSGP